MAEFLVRIWSDYIWPFCYVGLERAAWLERRFGAQVEWLPFDLHPEYPPEGILRSDLERRYGPGIHERTRSVIQAADLTYAPPPELPNSRRALAVTELARDRELHEPVHTRLMHAYWAEGLDIGNDAVLVDLVAEVGLDREEATAALHAEEYVNRVLASTQAANAHGIHAIPAFVLGDRLLVMGAQPHAFFEEAVGQLTETKEGWEMWKLLFLARRGWKLIPREHRRRVMKTAARNARRHGPTVAKAARQAVRQARKARR